MGNAIGEQALALLRFLSLLISSVPVTVLILIAGRMAFLIVMPVALLLGRRRGVAVATLIQIAWGVSLIVVVLDGFLGGLLCAHG